MVDTRPGQLVFTSWVDGSAFYDSHDMLRYVDENFFAGVVVTASHAMTGDLMFLVLSMGRGPALGWVYAASTNAGFDLLGAH